MRRILARVLASTTRVGTCPWTQVFAVCPIMGRPFRLVLDGQQVLWQQWFREDFGLAAQAHTAAHPDAPLQAAPVCHLPLGGV